MFLPWTRCTPPLVVTGRYQGLAHNVNKRGLIVLLTVEADTSIVLRSGTVLVLPAHAALVEQLRHDQVGAVVTIRYDGEAPRPDGRPGTALRHVFTVQPGAAGETAGP